MRFCHEYTVLSYERVRSLIWRNWGLGRTLWTGTAAGKSGMWNVLTLFTYFIRLGKTWKDVVTRKKIDMQRARFNATIQRPFRRLIHELIRYRYRGICPNYDAAQWHVIQKYLLARISRNFNYRIYLWRHLWRDFIGFGLLFVLREIIYAYPGMVRSVRYLTLDAGVGSVGVRAVGVGREEQHGLKQGTVEEQHTGTGEKSL